MDNRKINASLQKAYDEGYEAGLKKRLDNNSPVRETKSFVLDDSEAKSECCMEIGKIFAASGVCSTVAGVWALVRLMTDNSGEYYRHPCSTNDPMEITLFMGSFAGCVVLAGGMMMWVGNLLVSGKSPYLNKKSDTPEEKAQDQPISSFRK